MPKYAVLLCHACGTWPNLGDLHFDLTASQKASSGHFPGFVNSISVSLRWTIDNLKSKESFVNKCNRFYFYADRSVHMTLYLLYCDRQ